MNKLDFIYCKLCDKYGFENIAYKREIKTFYETKKNDESIFIPDGEPKRMLGSIYFVRLDTKEVINLKEEQENGTFK